MSRYIPERCQIRDLTLDEIEARTHRLFMNGWPKSKWLEFAETLIKDGYQVRFKEAKATKSKYLFVRRGRKEFKVRFSDHMPIKGRELEGDCDFFVGKTHTGIRNTNHALEAVQVFFGKGVVNV